jgi:hypothetical protein
MVYSDFQDVTTQVEYFLNKIIIIVIANTSWTNNPGMCFNSDTFEVLKIVAKIRDVWNA